MNKNINNKTKSEPWIIANINLYLQGGCLPLSSDLSIHNKLNSTLQSINHTIYRHYGGSDTEDVLMKFDSIYRVVWTLDNYSNAGVLLEFIETLKVDSDIDKLTFVFRIMKVKGANLLVKLELEALQNARVLPVTRLDRFILIDPTKIALSHQLFNDVLFESMNLSDYLECFNLNNPNPIHPRFISRQGISFIYFLSRIEDIRVNDEICLKQFGLKGFKTRKPKAKPTPVFVNQVNAILKIR
jgi:hypothetical protein